MGLQTNFHISRGKVRLFPGGPPWQIHMAGRAAPHSVAKPAAFRHAAMGVAGTQHHPMNIHYHLVMTNIAMENPPILSIFNR